MPPKRATSRAVELAKLAVFWDDEADDDLIQLFPPNNDPDSFHGDKSDLRAIRRAMKRYEKSEAEPFEDKTFYDARFQLQFVDVE